MAYIGQAPANKPVSASDLEDGLIYVDHIKN